MEGFLVFDYEARYPEARSELLGWVRNGKLKARTTVYQGPSDHVAIFALVPELLPRRQPGYTEGCFN